MPKTASTKLAALAARNRAAAKSLASCRRLIKASLCAMRLKCGKPSCRCAQGVRHEALAFTYKVIASRSESAGPAAKCPARRLPGAARQNLAIRLLGGTQPTELAATNGVSRKFLYRQAHKAETALDEAFADKVDESDVLFHLPVTAEWLDQFILGQVLICHASFRGVKEFMRDMLGVPVSIGTVHNVVMEAVESARALNAAEHLANVRVGAHDEIFQARQPVLVGADVDSTYCYLLSAENSRDGDTWALRLMELSDKNLRPDYTVADGGTGKIGVSKIGVSPVFRI